MPPHALARATASLISDGTGVARMAREVLQEATAQTGLRALAHSLLALVAFREGEVADGLLEVEAGSNLVDASPEGLHAAALLQLARALHHRREGRLAEAEALLRPQHEAATQRPATDAYHTAAALAIVLSMRDDPVGSLDVFYQALHLARQTGEDSLLVNALNNLGSFQADLYNLEDAAPLLEECLTRALRLGSRRQIIYAAANLVQCLCQMDEAPRALTIAREHLIARIRPDDPPALQRDEEIAHALLNNGMVDQAEAALGKQVRVDPMSNELATVRVWLSARILLARGDAASALSLCLARRELLRQQAEAGTVAIDRVNLLRLAAQAAHDAGQPALAYPLLDEAFAEHEQLLGRAARSRQLSLKISHRLAHAEWERDAAQQMTIRLESLNSSLQAQVAENERLQKQLRAQALEDPLTRLPNRRHLMDAGTALLSLMRRRGESLAVVIVDLDHFKQVNDRHGHECGDDVLRGFAALARRETRAEDLVCRYGGEEFVLLLPGAGAGQAAARVEHLLEGFRALQFIAAAGAFTCSFSAGVAVPSDADDTLAALLSRADVALYAAKQGGRGCVRVSPQARASAISATA